MSGEAWLYLLAVLINAVNLFLQVFFTIMYSDLEWYVCSPHLPRHRGTFSAITSLAGVVGVQEEYDPIANQPA
jgi:hypothetical protein